MALTTFFYARLTSPRAAANELVIENDPAVLIQFVPDGANGDVFLEYNDGQPDPDTQVVVGGVAYDFTYYVVGTLPTGNSKVPDVLEGKTVAKIILSDGRIFWFVLDGTGTQALMNSFGNGNLRLENTNFTPPTTLVCFCAGTQILTPSGYRDVESLVAGDVVMNDRGEPKQLLWTGHSKVSAGEMRANPDLRPIRIAANAIAPGRPVADLDVSPQHRVVLDGPEVDLTFGAERVLVAAKHLVGSVAEVAAPEADVTYVHLLCEEHEMLVSNGLVSESFQPARRTIEAMSEANRGLLVEVLEALGSEAMLSRKDALPSLKRDSARVLADAIARGVPAVPAERATADGARHAPAA